MNDRMRQEIRLKSFKGFGKVRGLNRRVEGKSPLNHAHRQSDRHSPVTYFWVAMLATVVASLSACSSDESTVALEIAPSDVSFLIPLKGVPDFKANTTGKHGTLLPRELFDTLPALTRVDEPDSIYDNLDVVGVRLDPCFVEGISPDGCTSQIRLVLQPVFQNGAPTSRDATLHLFYGVPLAELKEAVQALARLRSEGNGPTSVQPHFRAQDAAAIILQNVGANRLERITFITVHASDQAWSLGGFEVVGGQLEHLALLGVDDHEQHLSSVGGTDTLDATILPSPTIEPDAAKVLILAERENLGPSEFEAAKEAITRVLDPAVHNPGTVDCATCHMATSAARSFRLDVVGGPVSPVYDNTQNQRMFGFFGAEPSVSTRVLAETEVVVGYLNGYNPADSGGD